MSLSFQASRFEQFARAGRLRMTVKGGYENEHGNKLEQISSGGCRLSCSPGLPSCLLPSACLFVIGFVVCERGAPLVCPRTCICICVRTLVGVCACVCVRVSVCLQAHVCTCIVGERGVPRVPPDPTGSRRGPPLHGPHIPAHKSTRTRRPRQSGGGVGGVPRVRTEPPSHPRQVDRSRERIFLCRIPMKKFENFPFYACTPPPPRLRFKTPLVRGAPNTQLDQFQKIEALISSDLDHWLCNLYFQVCVCV